MVHYLNGVFARTSKNEPTIQENHKSRNLKSGFTVFTGILDLAFP